MRLSQKVALNYIRTKFKLLSAISKRKAAEKAFKLFCTPQHRNKKKLPRIFEQAESIRLKFHNYTIQGYRWNKEANEKILILHGFESSVINFDRYVKPLVSKGYCVLAFDAPAHGRSTGKEINVLIYKDFIDYINLHWGPVKNFLAHSLGGLALSLAIEKWEHDQGFKIVYIAPAVETRTAISTFFHFLRLDNEVRSEFDKVIEEKGGYPPAWYSIARAAEHIKATVLFFQDKDDHMTPLSDVDPIIKANHSNFKFILTEGLGHRRIYRDNKVSKAIIDFF
jgi:pimeloyl-ACP methyl ester carboxylesterase